MEKFDHADMIGGLLLIGVGLTVTFVSASSYPLGTLQRMGPGMFPAGLGIILAFLGAILAIRSVGVPNTRLDIRIITPVFVIISIAAFAFVIERFGLVPAIVTIVVISSIAELKFKPVSILVLSGVLCVIASLVFVVFLGLVMPLWKWPF